MERFFIGPVSCGELDIVDALDLFHGETGYMARRQQEAHEMEREVVLV